MQVRYASNSGAAYDLNRFGAHRQRGRKPNLTIAAPSAKARARAGMAAAFKTAAALALVAAFVVTMLYSRLTQRFRCAMWRNTPHRRLAWCRLTKARLHMLT